MLLGLIRPDEGNALLFGRDPLVDGARALDGVAGFVEAPTFYPYLTGRRNLELLAAFDGDGANSRVEESLATVELSDRGDDRVGGYSHGMRQRLGIAAALLRRPRLLLLDEPATGLDPAGMRDMRELIKRLSSEGMTVLLSSHLLAEVEELCNRVAIVRTGNVVYEGELAELKSQAKSEYELRTSDIPRTQEIAASMGLDAHASHLALRVVAPESEIAKLSIALGQAGIAITRLAAEQATLEDLFFRLTEGTAA